MKLTSFLVLFEKFVAANDLSKLKANPKFKTSTETPKNAQSSKQLQSTLQRLAEKPNVVET